MDELAHYNELSCARLLIRHVSLMGSLDEESSSLSPEWESRYLQLMSSLTLQLTEEDEEFCKKIIEFQRYQFALMHHLDAQESTRPLFLHLQLLLRQALAMPIESWLKKLPEFMELFSQKYRLLLELNLFFEQIQTELAEDGAFSIAFLESVTAWCIKFCENITEPQDFSEELIVEFNLRLSLVKQLLPYQRLLTEIQFGMEDDIVLMEECKDYTPEAINKLIGELRFNDSTQIRYLLLKLELLPFFSFISNLMLGSDDFLKNYPSLKEKIKKQLTPILSSFVGLELKEQVIAYSSYLNHICQLSHYLTDLAGELAALDAIKQSIPYLIDDPEIVQQALADAQSNTSPSRFKPYLRTLNEGLARILASTDESDKKEKLLATYQLFYKEPFKYNPYHSPVVSEHSLFKPAKDLKAETSVLSPTLV